MLRVSREQYESHLSEFLNSRPEMLPARRAQVEAEFLSRPTVPKKELKRSLVEYIFGKIRPITHFSRHYWTSLGYTPEQADTKISEVQTLNSAKLADAKQKNPSEYIDILPTQIGFWIGRGFSEEEAKREISKRQKTFTLEKCISTHGEIEGRRRFNDRQRKWVNSLKARADYDVICARKGKTHSYFVAEYGEEKAEEIRLAKIPKFGWFRASQESLKYFVPLRSMLIEAGYDMNDICLGADESAEFFLRGSTTIFHYDFCVRSAKLIIEFHGVAFHPKTPDDLNWKNPFNDTSAAKAFEHDRHKRQLAIDNGFKYMCVFSDESDILQKMKTFCGLDEKNFHTN